MQQKRQSFLSEASNILKTQVNQTTTFEELGSKFDSMARSEIVFLIEDTYGVDLWGKKPLKEFLGFEELLEFIEKESKNA